MHDNTFDNTEKIRPTPYDTGKVKIGVYYEPPRPTQDEDELALQDALLGGEWRPTASIRTKWQTTALVVCGILLYFIGLSFILR